MTVLRWFRGFTGAIQELADAVTELVRVQRELGPALERLEKLERLRHQFEAECEGALLKAEGKLRAASSAEQRERQLKKANERIADPFAEAGEEGEPALLRDNAPGGEAGPGLPPVHLALATNSKAHAVRAKFGI